jgi:C1A family cysteine protease
MEVLSRHWEELKARENYLNSFIGTKIKNGIDTKAAAIVIYVKHKLPCAEMAEKECIPTEIEGVPTDVVELNPKGWVADRTSVSELHPADQKHRLGLKPVPQKLTLAGPRTLKTPSGASEWTKFASAIQNQLNCGACPGFATCGVWETKLRLVANNPSLACKLSEAHVFFCTPGASCENGSDYPTILTQAMKGVCLESCLPYTDVDQACAAGICANWWLAAYKLAGYNVINDPTAIKVQLDSEPLAVSMAVYNSFFNYVSGVYQKVANDALAGYHAIGNLGYSDFMVADLIRNSWGPGWGQGCMVNGISRPGYCWIGYGQLDADRYQLLLDGPVPAPTPTPTQPLVITTKSLPAGKLGQTYTATLQASGGTPPYTWSASGTLPGGIGFSSAGILSGKPTQKGNFSVTFGVKDSSAGMSDDALNLTVKKRCFLGL